MDSSGDSLTGELDDCYAWLLDEDCLLGGAQDLLVTLEEESSELEADGGMRKGCRWEGPVRERTDWEPSGTRLGLDGSFFLEIVCWPLSSTFFIAE